MHRIRYFLTVVCCLIWAAASAADDNFNPENPGEPMTPQDPTKEYVTVTATWDPVDGGYVYFNNNYNHGATSSTITVEKGTSVSLHYRLNEEFSFVNWTEGGTLLSEERDINITADTDMTVTAHFLFDPGNPGEPTEPEFPEDKRVRVTIEPDPSDAGRIDWYSNSSSDGLYDIGTTIHVYEYANTGWVFTGWMQADTLLTSERHLYYTVQAENAPIYAKYIFDPNSPGEPVEPDFPEIYNLTVNVTPSDGGRIDSYSKRQEAGKDVRLYATPNDGYRFVCWTNGTDTVSYARSYTFTMPQEDVELTAHFFFDPGNPGEPSESRSSGFYGPTMSMLPSEVLQYPIYFEADEVITEAQLTVSVPSEFAVDMDGIVLAQPASRAAEGATLAVTPGTDDFVVTVTAPEGGIQGHNGILFYIPITAPDYLPYKIQFRVKITDGTMTLSDGETVGITCRSGFMVNDSERTTFEVDGIVYEPLSANTAAVTYKNDAANSAYTGHIVIPDSVTYMSITYTVPEIGESAFRAADVDSVTLGGNIAVIREWAFANSAIKTLNLNEGLSTLSENSLSDCSALRSLFLPSTMTEIRNNALARTPLRTVYSLPMTPPNLVANFYEGDSVTVYVPAGRVPVYEASATWNSAARILNWPGTIRISPATAEIRKGESITLTAAVTPSISLQEVMWKSVVDTMAVIEQTEPLTANITARTSGMLEVVAYSADGSCVSDTCRIHVKSNLAESISIVGGDTTAVLGAPVTLTALVLPEDIENKTVAWASANSAVATVDENGVVTPVAVGQTAVSAATTDGSNLSDTIRLTVVYAPSTGIEIDKPSSRIAFGNTLTLNAAVSPETADPAVTWAIAEGESVVEIVSSTDSSVLLNTMGVGRALITATTSDQLSDTAVVEVYGRIDIAPDTIEVKLRQPLQITAAVTPASGAPVQWRSLDESVATVSSSGELIGTVTGVALGYARIVAYREDGFCTPDTVVARVDYADPTGITVDKDSIRMRMYDTDRLTVTVVPPEAEQRVIWEVVDGDRPGVIEIADYTDLTVTIVGTGIGDAIIRAVSIDGQLHADVPVHVDPPLATGIGIDGGDREIILFTSGGMTATVAPAEAERRVAWTSLNPDVVTIDESGWMTARSIGTASVAATTTDGTNLSDTVSVTVIYNPNVEGVELDRYAARLHSGATTTFSATVLPPNTEPKVAWSVSEGAALIDIDVVDDLTVSVTGNGIGRAKIRATAGDKFAEAEIVVYGDLTFSDEERMVYTNRSLEVEVNTVPTGVAPINWRVLDSELFRFADDAVNVTTEENSVEIVGRYPGRGRLVAFYEDAALMNPDTCWIEVRPLPVAQVEILRGDRTVRLGDTMAMEAEVSPSDAYDTRVAWSSESPEVASIDENGVLTARSIGTTVIRATAMDGNGAEGRCVITVIYRDAEGVVLDSEHLNIKVGLEESVAAIVVPDLAEQKVSWEVVEGEGNIISIVDRTDLTLTLHGHNVGDGLVRAVSADGLQYAELPVTVYPWEKSPAVTPEYDGRELTLVCEDREAELYFSIDNDAYSSSDEHVMLAPELREVYAYSHAVNKLPSDTMRYEVPCFYAGGEDMYLHMPETMEKALQWCGGTVDVDELKIFGNIGAGDFALIRSLDGLTGVDFSETSLYAQPSLAGMTSLKWAGLPAGTIAEGVFEGCPNLGAVLWGSTEEMPESLLDGVENPNLLVYVPETGAAPEGVANVVTGREGNYRAESIVLSDDASTPNPYYAPFGYFAEEISYVRNFAQESGFTGETRGYESIMLPFTVQRYSHPVNGACAPFAAERTDDVHPFWLYEMGDNPQAAPTVEAYKPYLISMPNNDRHYYDDEELAGDITFSATSTYVEATPATDAGTWRGAMATVAKGEGVYAINVGETYEGNAEGSVWVNNLRDVRTFEAYIVMDSPNQVFGIFDPSSIEEIVLPGKGDFQAWTDGSDICVVASRDAECGVYDVSGALVRKVRLTASDVEHIGPLAHGIYIVRVGRASVKVRL